MIQPLAGGSASPGEPLAAKRDSFVPEEVLAAGKLQARWLNTRVGRQVGAGRLTALLREHHEVLQDLDALSDRSCRKPMLSSTTTISALAREQGAAYKILPEVHLPPRFLLGV